MAFSVNNYSRTAPGIEDRPPPARARFFYTSPYALDDPLSPLPPPLAAGSPARIQAPRPFSAFDDKSLEEAWMRLRKQVHQASVDLSRTTGWERKLTTKNRNVPLGRDVPRPAGQEVRLRRERAGTLDGASSQASSLSVREVSNSLENASLTRNPFIRAPSRKHVDRARNERSQSRPPPQALDSYDWDDISDRRSDKVKKEPDRERHTGPCETIPVGTSRLHSVTIPQLKMEPIYWSPLNDIAPVVRATWFYRDTLLPVESDVANMLEAGYAVMRPWSETWKDELRSALDVGALGEERIVHRLWPERRKSSTSRSSTAQAVDSISIDELGDEDDPEKERQKSMKIATAIIDSAVDSLDIDNKASGQTPFGRDGQVRQYVQSSVIYANTTDAYILRPNLLPSDYHGRRPYANYIRKGHKVGIAVLRGFDQSLWDRLHPSKQTTVEIQAMRGISSAEAGMSARERQKFDADLAMSERPQVTDLVLVIHGIGQKLSERMESYNFTYAMNAFRREVNVELGTDSVKSHLRGDMGGIMVLPVNWRLGLSFEDGGYRDGTDDPSLNHYSLKDITPETLPSVRGIVSDVMLDIPYYLSQEHNPKMVTACIKEANRIYQLWCANNPGFSTYGRVHILAHSLGSVMAFDILSDQPTYVNKRGVDSGASEAEASSNHFLFDTSTLITVGSPVGFFLLLKRAALLPREGRQKPGSEDTTSNTPGVTGRQGMYGCLSVDNIYNVVNGYDPVAYRLNATFDAAYSNSLKQAYLPGASKNWSLSNPFLRATPESTNPIKPPIPRLPSNVELETHNFNREEVAEERAYLLNDNGQVDFFMRYGGGPLEIQYLTMLSAHSSYWISKEFVRFLVVEIGRKPGREGTIPAMRAQKKKKAVV